VADLWFSPGTRIAGVMVSMFTSSVVDPRYDQINDYAIVIGCFSDEYRTLRSKSKNRLAWNKEKVSWSDMSNWGLLFQ